jgi:hypothetical protein
MDNAVENTNKTGFTRWALMAGHIPLHSIGREPECTSRDEIRLLNIGVGQIQVSITIFYTDRSAVGPFKLTVSGQRLRVIRVNDLIDPEPVMLDTDYAALIESEQPVILDFFRIDSSSGTLIESRLNAFPF